MSTRKQTQRTRAFRPEADSLESRQLLSGMVTGTDSKGDIWTLQLVGPGQLSVLKQNDSNGNPAPLNSATDIKSITIGGTDPLQSRLIGTVNRVGAGSDGRVFFNNLIQLGSRSERFGAAGLGLVSVSMPNFWLGRTTPASSSAAATATLPSISMPDGVATLQFGGVDATHNLPTPTSSSQSDMILVSLGLPSYGGSRILIDRSITGSQSAPSSTAGGTPTVIQHGVDFGVSGRLNLFQANSIDGDASTPPGQFSKMNSSATGIGGTYVVSGTPALSGIGEPGDPAIDPSQIPGIKGAVTGQIGDVRIGGNATNFSTIVYDATGSGGAKLSNFSIGGQTNYVSVVAPDSARNLVFGNGMDTVEVHTHVINTLQVNGEVVNSTVIADRQISRVVIGADVVNSQILSGYSQNFTNLTTTITTIGDAVRQGIRPSLPYNAVTSGGMAVHVAGSVQNSVFAASYQPAGGDFSVFGAPGSLALTGGQIKGKIEGTVNNSTIAPSSPLTAFYAKNVTAYSGPVVPPAVPQAPYTNQTPVQLPGLNYSMLLRKYTFPKANSTSKK